MSWKKQILVAAKNDNDNDKEWYWWWYYFCELKGGIWSSLSVMLNVMYINNFHGLQVNTIAILSRREQLGDKCVLSIAWQPIQTCFILSPMEYSRLAEFTSSGNFPK